VIVVDASALVEVLLRTPAAAAVQDRLFSTEQTLHAPHLIDIEVAQVRRAGVSNLGAVATPWTICSISRWTVTPMTSCCGAFGNCATV